MSGARDHLGRPQPNPYAGGRPFRRSERDRFFGRDAESQAVRSLWLESRLLVVHGAGAAGKTSLIQAGVLPLAAETPGVALLPLARLTSSPRTRRETGEAGSCYPSAHGLLELWAGTQAGAQTRFPDRSLAGFFISLARGGSGGAQPAVSSGQPTAILAPVDQLEKIFLRPAGESALFLRELADAIDAVPELRVLLVTDTEAVSQVRARVAELGVPGTAYYELGRLSRAAALEAIARPLSSGAHSLAPGAAGELADRVMAAELANTELANTELANTELANTEQPAKVAGDAVDPLLLQIIAAEFWSSLPPEHHTVTAEEVSSFVDPGRAFRHFYDNAIARAHAETGQPENAIRGWVEETFTVPGGQRRSARRGRAVTSGMSDDVVDVLIESHFLQVKQRGASEWCQLGYATLVEAIHEVNRVWRSVAGEQALEHVPNLTTPDVLFEAARDALIEGDTASARSFAALAVESYRGSADERNTGHALLLSGEIARSQGDLGMAEENFQDALSRFAALDDRNLTARALSALGEVRMLAGDYRKAAEFQQLAIDQLPTDVRAMVGLGYAQWLAGSPADAEASFSRALEWDSRSAAALLGRGQVRAEMRDYYPALRDIDKALASGLSAYDETDALSARGLALAGVGRRDEAEQTLDAALRREPVRARTLLRSARVSEMSGRPEKAASALAEALNVQPGLPPREAAVARRLEAKLRVGLPGPATAQPAG